MLCRFFRCHLDERACVARQLDRNRFGNATKFEQCAAGKCDQGAEVRTRLEATGRLAEVLTRIEEGKAWQATRSMRAMTARAQRRKREEQERRSAEPAERREEKPAERPEQEAPASLPAQVVHPVEQKETPMAEKRKCVTCKKSTLRANSVGEECFRCRLAASKVEKPVKVEKLRSVEKTEATILPPPWPEAGTARPAAEILDGLASFYASLTTAQLRAHHEALKADAGRRIREADELKDIAPTAFAGQLEVA